ncbi:hypothetical protein [Mangrovibacterium lignilyticum]|uniref:hypothetical protein n=1 Tax=Mangrovibacterium lignilyticum TaxID=2668052 RepID=UPI0013D71309|nr:hypothetical protein [Mangrovibacterium lignilyticum]
MKFAAHYIITGTGDVLPKGIVEVDSSGQITRVIANENGLVEQARMEFHSGVICPAFPDLFHLFSLSDLFEKLPQLKPFKAFLPANTQDPKAVFNWIRNIQVNDESCRLPELIALFCSEVARIAELKDAGTIAPGKRPGLVLLYVMKYSNLQLNEDSRMKTLI